MVPQPVPNPQPAPLSTTIGTAEKPVRLQFPNTDVKDVLAFYEKLAGVRLVYDNQVVGTVNIVINEDIPRDEAKLIIEINLLLNGFTLVPVANSKIVKVIGIGKSPRTAGIPIVADELLIPDGEHVVTYLARLKFADPQEVTQVLGTFVVQSPGQYTNITPLPKSSAILITENSAILRGLLKVIHEMDIPPAEVVSEFLVLERADAEDVQKKLLEVFNKTPAAGAAAAPAAGGARPAQRGGQPAILPDGTPVPAGITAEQTGQNTIEISSGKLSEDSIIVGKITLTADKRTNRLHVVTRPSNIKFVRKLVKEFDENVKYGEPSIRKLKFVNAEDIFDVVVKAISDPGAQDAATTGAGATGAGGQRTTTPAGGQQSNLFGNRGQTGGTGTGTGGGGGSQSLSESLSAPERAIKPNAVTVGNTRIIADNRANSIIVLGNQEVKDKLFKVIDELDVRAPQVLLHTVIGQLTLSDSEQFGINYFVRKANALGQIPNGATTVTTPTVPTDPANPGTPTTTNSTGLFNVADIVTTTGNTPALNFNNLLTSRNFQTALTATGASGLSGFIAGGNTLDAIVTALQSTNRFRVTARPSLFTNNNKKAIIASGEEIAIPTTIQSGFNGNTGGGANNLVTNSQIQFKTVALSLEILPFINADREVVLDIVQKFDEQVGTTRIDNNDIPRIATRVLQSNVSVPNEATLVLGGLIKQNNNKTTSGIPYLSKIPYLGALFRTTTTDKRREELVILIRPVVTFGPGESVQTRERAQEFLNIPPDLEATIFPDGRKGSTTAEKMLRKPPVKLRDGITPAPQTNIKRR